MPTFYSWNAVVYRIYETAGYIASDSEYGFGVYANSLGMFSSNTMSCEETIFCELYK